MTINKRAVRSVKKNISFYIISTILTVLISILIIAAVIDRSQHEEGYK